MAEGEREKTLGEKLDILISKQCEEMTETERSAYERAAKVFKECRRQIYGVHALDPHHEFLNKFRKDGRILDFEVLILKYASEEERKNVNYFLMEKVLREYQKDIVGALQGCLS